MVSMDINIIPDTKDNIGCTTFPPAGLGVVVEFFFMQINDNAMDVPSLNVTGRPPTTTQPPITLPAIQTTAPPPVTP